MGRVTVAVLTVGVIVETVTVVSLTKNSNIRLGNKSQKIQNSGWVNQLKESRKDYIGARSHVALMNVVKVLCL